MAEAQGVVEENLLRSANTPEEVIQKWKAETRQQLLDANTPTKLIDEYFGIKEPNLAPVQEMFKQNLAAHATAQAESKALQNPNEPSHVREAKSLWDAISAGWQMSTVDLALKHGEPPNIEVAQNSPSYWKIAQGIAQTAGDVPAMIIGGAAGTMAGGGVGGAVAGPPGAAVVGVLGAGAGAFALPTAVRETLIDGYKNGSLKSFGDFWERATPIFLDTMKSAAVGAATGGVGAVTGKVLAPVVSPFTKVVGTTASEVATMTTVGAALDGRVPEPEEFVNAAAVVAGLHVAGMAAKPIQAKLYDIYAKTGVRPSEVANDAHNNPSLLHDLASSSKDIPDAYKAMDQKPTPRVEIKAPELTTPQGGNPEMPSKIEVDKLPEVKQKEAVAVEVSPEQKAMLDRIGPAKEVKPPLLQTLKDPNTWEKVYTAGIDELNPLNQLTKLLTDGKPLPSKNDPYLIARVSKGSFGKANRAFEFGPFDFNDPTKSIGPSLKVTLDKVENLNEFKAWSIAAHSIEREAKGKATGVPQAEAKKVFEAGRKKFEPVNRELQDFKNGMIDYLAGSGIVAKDVAEKIKSEYQYHVPFNRTEEAGGPKGQMGSGQTAKNPIKTAYGSEAQLVDPIESIIRNTYRYVEIAERNRIGLALLEAAKVNPELSETLIKKVPTAMKPIKVSAEEVAKFLDAKKIEGEAEAFDIFRPAKRPLGKNEIPVFKDGKMEVYEIPEAVAAAIKGLDSETVPLFLKLLSKPAKLLRAGTTITPEFVVKNPVTDQFSAFMLSKNGYNPIDAVRGLMSIIGKDKDFRDWQAHGGANAAIASLDRDYIQNNIFKLSESTGLLDSAINVVKHPIEMLRVASELMENATRVGEFKKAVSKGKDPFTAAFEAREVTLDFQKIGAQTKAINQITAFWNVGVQGLDRTIRAAKEDPIGFGARAAAAVATPSVLLWAANHDDPRWKKIQRWQRDMYWIILTKDHIFRIKKPFEVGVFVGSGIERTLDAYFDKDPKAFKDFQKSVLSGITPGFVPTFASPIIDHFANRSNFTGNKIIPSTLEGIFPENQFKDYTSESAKAIGKIMRTMANERDLSISSPLLIENYIRAWTGGMGMYALKLADKALGKAGILPDPVRPADTLADMPFIKAFTIRYPSASVQSIEDFYDTYSENKKFIDNFQYLQKNGEVDLLLKETKDPEFKQHMVNLTEIKDILGQMSKLSRDVAKDPKKSPDDKRLLIDNIYREMIKISEAGNLIFDKIKNKGNTK